MNHILYVILGAMLCCGSFWYEMNAKVKKKNSIYLIKIHLEA